MQRRESIRPKTMTRTFVIQNSLNSDLAMTNMIYMNPHEVTAPYVSIGRFVYRCAGHPDIFLGRIGLNAVHRRQNSKMAGDSVQVSDFVMTMKNFDIKSVTLKAERVKSSDELPMDIVALANKFRTDFDGHIMTRDQMFLMDYQGENILLTVTSDVRGMLTLQSEVGIHWNV